MQKLPCLLFVIIFTHFSSFAQKGKKEPKEKVPVYNYVIDDPMDVFGRQPVKAPIVKYSLVPEFYRPYRNEKDTVLDVECYDAANKIIKPDTITTASSLRYLSVVKTYPDPVNTYKDDHGVKRPLPVQQIIRRYDKVGADKWFSVDYTTNKSMTLQEFSNEIVRVDTITVIDPITSDETTHYRRYYKVSAVK
jgi:hypothetical protein